MIDVAFYLFIAALAVGVTIYRVRRREYYALGLWLVLVLLIVGNRLALEYLPPRWNTLVFWGSAGGVIAWAIVATRQRKMA